MSNPAERYWAMKNAELLEAMDEDAPYTCPECCKPTPEEGPCDDCAERIWNQKNATNI